MSSAADYIYAAEERTRHYISLVEKSKSSSIEYLNSLVVLEPVIRFGNVDHACRYAEKIAKMKGYDINCRAMNKSDKKGYLGAYRSGTTIIFNPEAEHLDQLLVLHEVAHVLSTNKHNADFAYMYRELVDEFIGSGVALILSYEIYSAKGTLSN